MITVNLNEEDLLYYKVRKLYNSTRKQEFITLVDYLLAKDYQNYPLETELVIGPSSLEQETEDTLACEWEAVLSGDNTKSKHAETNMEDILTAIRKILADSELKLSKEGKVIKSGINNEKAKPRKPTKVKVI